jgi:hypothetical protein
MSTKTKKLSNKKVAEIVEHEGLGDAVFSYLGADGIADPILAAHWKQASDSLKAIVNILQEHLEW